MAAAENSNAPRDWKKRESFTSAMAQILIVALLLSGAVFFFYQKSTKKKEIADRLKEAKTLAVRDNPEDLTRAFAELEAIFELDSHSKEALALAGEIETQRWLVHRMEGAEQRARDYIAKAAKEESRTEERFASQLLILVAEGKAEEAEKLAEELRKQGASTAKLWYGLGEALQARGNLPLARQAFAKSIEMAWRNPRLFAGYGEAMIDQADYRTAVDVLQKGLNANADHVRAQLGLALARVYRQERVKDAADAVQEVLSRGDAVSPGMRARALAVSAELANFEQRYDEAIELARQSLAQNPEERYALFARAKALALKKDPGAADAFNAAIARNRSSALLYFTGAELLQQAGNFPAALGLMDAYQKFFSAVQIPDGETTRTALDRDDRYWINRGNLFRTEGKQAEAMASFDQAVAVDGVNRRQAHHARGALYLDQKDYDKALEELDKVTPEDGTGMIPAAYEAKGRALFGKQEFAMGCQHFAFALTGMRRQGVPRERLNALLDDVTRSLVANKQKDMSKIWDAEARPLIQ